MSLPRPARTDPAADPSLRAGLEALAALEPNYDAVAGVQRFEAALVAAPRWTGRAKLAVVTTVAVVLVGAAGLAARSSARPAAEAHASASLDPLVEAAQLDPLTPALAATVQVVGPATPKPPQPLASGVADQPESRSPAVRPKRNPPRAQPEVPGRPAKSVPLDDVLTREMRLLNATRRQLAEQPQSALWAIADARETISPLRFDEEWDALEILALAGADRLEEAERRAESFTSQHRNGRFDSSIASALDEARSRIER